MQLFFLMLFSFFVISLIVFSLHFPGFIHFQVCDFSFLSSFSLFRFYFSLFTITSFSFSFYQPFFFFLILFYSGGFKIITFLVFVFMLPINHIPIMFLLHIYANDSMYSNLCITFVLLSCFSYAQSIRYQHITIINHLAICLSFYTCMLTILPSQPLHKFYPGFLLLLFSVYQIPTY